MDIQTTKEQIVEVLEEALLDLKPDEYAYIEDGSNSTLFVLKGDGRIAGSYHFASIAHIDDIASSNLPDDLWPSINHHDVYKIDPQSPEALDSFDVYLALRLGHDWEAVEEKFKNKLLSFDQLFDLMSGPKREGRYFGNNHCKTEDVTLTKDVVIDVLVEKDDQYVWENRLLGQKGDTVQVTSGMPYAIYNHDGHLGAFLLDHDEYEKAPSLAQSVKGKRARSSANSKPSNPSF